MAVFSMRAPFDETHQKRVFVLHLENVSFTTQEHRSQLSHLCLLQTTSQEHHLHLATADGAPGFHSLVTDIANEFAATGSTLVPVVMDDYNSDWDPLYPFSAVRHRCSN